MHRLYSDKPALRLVLGLACLLAGCASDPPPSDAVRRSITSVGVLATGGGTRIEAETPTHDSGKAARMVGGDALRTGGAIMKESLSMGMGAVFVLPLGAAVAIVGAPVGAAVAASRTRDRGEVDTAAAALAKALAAIKPDDGLRDAIASRTPAGMEFRALRDGSDPRALQAAGIDTVLEVAVSRYGLETSGRIDPDLRIALDVTVRLVRAADGAELHRRSWRHSGAARNYFRMAAGDGAAVRADFAEAYAVLARRIVDHLFIAPAPAANDPPPLVGRR